MEMRLRENRLGTKHFIAGIFWMLLSYHVRGQRSVELTMEDHAAQIFKEVSGTYDTVISFGQFIINDFDNHDRTLEERYYCCYKNNKIWEVFLVRRMKHGNKVTFMTTLPVTLDKDCDVELVFQDHLVELRQELAMLRLLPGILNSQGDSILFGKIDGVYFELDVAVNENHYQGFLEVSSLESHKLWKNYYYTMRIISFFNNIHWYTYDALR